MPAELEARGSAAALTLNGPEALNALRFAILRELAARVGEVDEGIARGAVERTHDRPVREGLEVEADAVALACQSVDAAEGMSAFAEKRPPAFRDA